MQGGQNVCMSVPACVMSDLYIEKCNGNHSGLSGFSTIVKAAQLGRNILAITGRLDDTKDDMGGRAVSF